MLTLPLSLKRTLKKAAQNCQRARAKLADLQRTHGESDALQHILRESKLGIH